jgi:putative transposase
MSSSESSELNRSISDVGFYNFRLFLQYKSKERFQELIIVNPAYTSQTCSSCGNIDRKSRKTQADFECVSCGFEINADLNASINILSRGTTQVTQSKPLG